MKTIYKYLLFAACILLMPLYGKTNFTASNIPSCFTVVNAGTNYMSLDFLTISAINTDTLVATGQFPKSINRHLKVFKVYPNPASNIVYLRISGKQTITLHNAQDSLIFKTAIREKAIINIRQLPAGTYHFTEEKTGLTQEMVIAR